MFVLTFFSKLEIYKKSHVRFIVFSTVKIYKNSHVRFNVFSSTARSAQGPGEFGRFTLCVSLVPILFESPLEPYRASSVRDKKKKTKTDPYGSLP